MKIDEDTFSEMEQRSTFICAKGDETWLPQTVSASASVSLSIDSNITAGSMVTQSSNKLGIHIIIRG